MAASAHSAPYTFVPVFEMNVDSKTKVVLTKLEYLNSRKNAIQIKKKYYWPLWLRVLSPLLMTHIRTVGFAKNIISMVIAIKITVYGKKYNTYSMDIAIKITV